MNGAFFNTYYYCNIIQGVLEDQFSYIRTLNDFYCDDLILGLVIPFQKFSAFHQYISFVFDRLELENPPDIKQLKDDKKRFANIPEIGGPFVLPIESAFRAHDIEHESFVGYLADRNLTLDECTDVEVDEYCSSFWDTQPWEDLVEAITNEVFHVLFHNRKLMLAFNLMLAEVNLDSE